MANDRRGVSARDAANRVWAASLAVRAWSHPDVWLHGDLHPGNRVVDNGRLSGVIDVDHLVVGDPPLAAPGPTSVSAPTSPAAT